jgi:endonuclease YncB( thermonuclease family)
MKTKQYGNRWLGLLLAIFMHSTVLAAELAGQVVGVLDGDTIEVLTLTKSQVRVRLAGIDAPEKGQAFGNAAKKALSDLVLGKPVIVEWQRKDRYGRMVGKVIVNGVDANLKMVEAGLAWHYKQYAKEQLPADRARYAKAEEDAGAEDAGLWRDKLPVPPWEFRKKRPHAL